MFKSVLIANRGEIALRIMQTAKRMGMRTIAVYSEADTNALHVKEADEAVFIGPSPAAQSYLNVDALLSAITRSGAECVHPGYGFLSENEGFCRAVTNMGVAFVGPGADAIRKMGDKIESKKIASAAGVNTVPGLLDAISDIKKAREIALQIGFPVMIKAAAGGGGKGMRVAHSEADLQDGMSMASSEAKSSFGDARVFIEKFFVNPRHIEIQILADAHGNILSLGERECSIQRRHQKVIEEAPSSFVTPEMRKLMSDQSVALAREVGYKSAGTVEYIVDQNGEFYFLEMNTRLQVEHRVTELITGLDLVEQMFRVAAGEKLAFTQEEVQINGWAFESRVYAEDPARGFLPSTGRVSRYQTPAAKPGLVVDSGVYEGGEVSMFYDPMIAKICSHAPTREGAIDLMRQALGDTIIRGIAHNVSFLLDVLAHPRFASGDICTNFIEQEYPAGFIGDVIDSEAKRVCMAVATFCYLRMIERAAQISGQLKGRTRAIGQRWVVEIGGRTSHAIYVRPREHGYDIGYDGGLIVIRSSWKLGNTLFQGTVNGLPISVKTLRLPEGYLLSYAGYQVKAVVRSTKVAELAQYMPDGGVDESDDELRAPIAGLVSKIHVSAGQAVKAGEPLCVIEAMKMENIMYAENDCVIAEVHINAPASVAADELLISFGDKVEQAA